DPTRRDHRGGASRVGPPSEQRIPRWSKGWAGRSSGTSSNRPALFRSDARFAGGRIPRPGLPGPALGRRPQTLPVVVRRVLDLHPAGEGPRPVGAALPLRDDAIEVAAAGPRAWSPGQCVTVSSWPPRVKRLDVGRDCPVTAAGGAEALR